MVINVNRKALLDWRCELNYIRQMGIKTIFDGFRSNTTFALFSRTLKLQPPEADGRQESRLEVYRTKALTLKQIMSRKARFYRRVNDIQNILTVAVTSLLLFMGFSGLPKIQEYISLIYPTSPIGAEFTFNMSVFLLFVIGVLHLVFRFPEKQSNSEKGIASLAALANEIDDIITSRGNLVISEDPSKISLTRTRYEAIAENLPANSEREYFRAKDDIAKKSSKKPVMLISTQELFDPARQLEIVSSIAMGSRLIVDSLILLRSLDDKLYLGGGVIRSAVWDFLHGYNTPTRVDDVDVILFDRENVEKKHDSALEKKLSVSIPNEKWSVKNQARMHTINADEPYESLEDAVSKWPETATAFVARLTPDGQIQIVAPHGLDDLLRLVVRNTPHFAPRMEIIERRINEKRWKSIWPRLRFLLPPTIP